MLKQDKKAQAHLAPLFHIIYDFIHGQQKIWSKTFEATDVYRFWFQLSLTGQLCTYIKCSRLFDYWCPSVNAIKTSRTHRACFSVPSAIAKARLRAAFTSLTRVTWASVPVPAAARLARKRRARAGVSLSSEFWVWGSRWSNTKASTLQSCKHTHSHETLVCAQKQQLSSVFK